MIVNLNELPQEEYLLKGHTACPGCGGTLALRLILKALGDKTMMVLPACCWTNIAGFHPLRSLEIPVYHVPFAAGAAAGAGLSKGLELRGDHDVTVLVWAGDGGTFDIGLQSLSGAAERNDNILYITYDNEGYMNTGVQRSSATPQGAWTTTTPVYEGNSRPKKDIIAILANHNVPYTATASAAYANDLVAKVQKAKQLKGTKFIHVLAPCPLGWRYDPSYTVKLARVAVESKIFPLYEVTQGNKYAITYEPAGIPVGEYLDLQGRFAHLSDQKKLAIQDNVNEAWEDLARRAGQYS
ncbi:MAG: thiamine pyrophosphate-dependent enzyme [Bacillota bacterium]